ALVNGEDDDDTEATTVADTLCEGGSCETGTAASEGKKKIISTHHF
ncbi:unnamed protein product, partial [Rotaria magnacalcarata]